MTNQPLKHLTNVQSGIAAAPKDSRQAKFHSEDSQLQDFRSKAEAHAAKESPREACGVVVAGAYYPCRNIANDPEQDFAINPVDYARAALLGKIEAIVHSHPKGGPASEADRAACHYTKLPWHIYSLPDRQWSTINLY